MIMLAMMAILTHPTLSPHYDPYSHARIIVDHRWVRHDGDNLAARHLGDNLRKFKAFRGRMKLRGIVKGIIAVNRFKNALGVKKLSTLKEARASLVPGATGDSLKESSEKKAEKVEKEEEEGGEGGEVVASEGIEVTV